MILLMKDKFNLNFCLHLSRNSFKPHSPLILLIAEMCSDNKKKRLLSKERRPIGSLAYSAKANS